MKHIFIFILVATFGILKAQSNYEKGMNNAFELWKANKTEEAQNLFERIANAEKDNWLPHYYIAQINSLKSWNVKDEKILKAQLDKAQQHVSTAMKLSKDNPELLVMQGQIYTNWVAFDGRTYGMKYSAKISELYNIAYALAPENPRVVMCKADWAMGSAKYFGQETQPFCKDLETALLLFKTFEPKTNYHPDWGEMRAQEALKQCKS